MMDKIKLNLDLSIDRDNELLSSERSFKFIDAKINVATKYKCFEIIKNHAKTLKKLHIKEEALMINEEKLHGDSFNIFLKQIDLPKLEELTLQGVAADILILFSMHLDLLKVFVCKFKLNGKNSYIAYEILNKLLQVSSLEQLILPENCSAVDLYSNDEYGNQIFTAPKFKLKKFSCK